MTTTTQATGQEALDMLYSTGQESPSYIINHYAAVLDKLQTLNHSPARTAQLLNTYTHVFLNRAPLTNYTTATALKALSLPAQDLADLNKAGVIEATATASGATDYYLETFAWFGLTSQTTN